MPVPAVQDSESANKLYELIRRDAIEMGVLKSDMDVDQFTVNSVGNFPAHKFHFLLRQYSLALLELRRLYNDRRKLEMKQAWVVGGNLKVNAEELLFLETELEEIDIQLDQLDLSIVNKRSMCERFEKMRLVLIDQHGKPFTNEEYQAEEPAYWCEQLNRMIEDQLTQRETGISEGVCKLLRHVEETPVLNSENKLETRMDTVSKIKVIKPETKPALSDLRGSEV